MTEDEWRASVGPYIRGVVESGEYPTFARQVVEAVDTGPAERFEFGLACVLDGVTAVTSGARDRAPRTDGDPR